MALFADKKKLGQGVCRRLLRELERVAIVRAEVLFDGARAVVIIRLAAGYLDRQPRYARIKLGQLQVIQSNLRGEISRGLTQQFRFDLGDIGTRHVDANRLVGEDRARQILGDVDVLHHVGPVDLAGTQRAQNAAFHASSSFLS